MHRATKIGAVPKLRELTRDEAQSTAALCNVLMLCSAGPLQSEYCQRSIRAILSYAAAYSTGMGVLVLISADEPPPSEATRQLIRESYSAFKDVVIAGVMMIEGEGFAAAAKRSIMTLITRSASQPFPMRVASSTLEGATKLADMMGARLDPMLDPEQIAAAAAELKRGPT